MEADPGKQWIVKPSASSQGKGIFLTSNVQDVFYFCLLLTTDPTKAEHDSQPVHLQPPAHRRLQIRPAHIRSHHLHKPTARVRLRGGADSICYC